MQPPPSSKKLEMVIQFLTDWPLCVVEVVVVAAAAVAVNVTVCSWRVFFTGHGRLFAVLNSSSPFSTKGSTERREIEIVLPHRRAQVIRYDVAAAAVVVVVAPLCGNCENSF